MSSHHKTTRGFTSTSEERRGRSRTWRPSAVEAKAVPAFTLIEALIYIALFGIIIGGAVVAVYSIVESQGRSQEKVIIQQEGVFLVSKINWAMASVQSVDSPPVGTGAMGVPLTVSKWDGSTVTIEQVGTDMTINRGAGVMVLNNTNVRVSDLRFIHEYDGGASPESVTATFVLSATTPNGQTVSGNFSTTNYVRR